MPNFKQKFKNKQYEECLKEVEGILVQNPTATQPLVFKSFSMNELGMYLNANRCISKILGMDHKLDQKQVFYLIELKWSTLIKATEQVNSNERYTFTLESGTEVTFPRNMSWIIPGKVAGSSMPKREEQIKGFEEFGITTVINMMDENEVKLSIYKNSPISHHIFGIPNRTAPSIQMMDTIMNIMEDTVGLGGSVLIHCGGGVGRAGTVLACYILKHGITGKLNRNFATQLTYNATSCVEELRKLRPKSIESDEQEKGISDYNSHLWELSAEKDEDDKIYNIKFPSIPYLSISPDVDQNDPVTNFTLNGKNIVITEKMDGENCCMYNGKVFARTHSHEATHESFTPIKQMYKQKILPMNEVYNIPNRYMLFGENMTGIHSITYDKLENYFYLFGVFDTDSHVWLGWDQVEKVARDIDVPTVPVIFRGVLCEEKIKILMDKKIKTISICSTVVGPEGFVVRNSHAFVNNEFSTNISKYVRHNHKQTDETWRRTWKKATLVDIGSKENETHETKLTQSPQQTQNKTTGKRNLPKLIILCGLPGSGKSSFAKTLKNNSDKWAVISQDELGSRGKCEEEFSKSIKGNKSIILDRCNHTKADRNSWYQMAMLTDASKSLVVYFDTEKEVCIPRVKGRANHETIPIGRGENVVETFAKAFEIPDPNENIGEIKVISSIEETNNLLHHFGSGKLIMENTLLKFPRTPHLFDAREFNSNCDCTVTRDDLLMGTKDRKEFLNTPIVLQEKIDGANMGFSLGTDMKILAQNRSHYVNSATADQFKKLDEWISTHYGDLYTILEDGRYILYGEWCYAKHGIHYDSLPNYFIAFDLYDRYHEKFLSTQRFFAKLAQAPSITHVPLLTINSFTKLEEINKFLTKKSEFTDGNIEGVYIRKEDNDYLISRCKVIAPTFMESFDKHWTHKEFVKNVVMM